MSAAATEIHFGSNQIPMNTGRNTSNTLQEPYKTERGDLTQQTNEFSHIRQTNKDSKSESRGRNSKDGNSKVNSCIWKMSGEVWGLQFIKLLVITVEVGVRHMYMGGDQESLFFKYNNSGLTVSYRLPFVPLRCTDLQ